MREAVAYYAHHGSITDPRDHADLFRALGPDVVALSAVVQGVLIHPLAAHLYDVKLSPEQIHDQTIRSVARKLARMRETDPQPLHVARPPHQRLASQCYGFATLLCAMLRHHGVPARVRSGFAHYFATPDFVYNHWLCEYWREDEQRWVLVDAQLDAVQLADLGATFDPHDVPCDLFNTAAEVWQQCRAHKAEPGRFGYDEVPGFGYIGCQLVLDVACLNKVELLATDRWGVMDDTVPQYNSATGEVLDRVAALAGGGNHAVEELRRIYKHDARLQAPAALATSVS